MIFQSCAAIEAEKRVDRISVEKVMLPLVFIYKKDQGHMTLCAVGTLKQFSMRFGRKLFHKGTYPVYRV